MADKKQDIASLTRKQFEALQSGEVVLVPVDFIADSHKYDYQKTISAHIKKEFGDADFMSASKLGELLKGLDKESIMALKEVVKTLDPVKDAAKKIKYQKMIAAGEARQAAFAGSDASAYGTAFHRVVELIERGTIGKNGVATNEQIIKYLRSEQGRNDKELEFISKYIKNDKGEGNASTQRVLENVQQYLSFKEKNGMAGEVLSEKHVAAFIKVGDEIVKIAGTFDQFWKQAKMLTDLKTSSKTSADYGLQINAYARLIEALTGEKPVVGKILQAPRAKTSSAGVNDVKIVANDLIDEMLASAYKIYTSKDAKERVAAIEAARDKKYEERMGFQSRVERVEREGKNGKWTDTLINGRSIYDKKSWTPEELVSAVSLLPQDDREDILAKIFGTVDFETNPKSERGFDIVRREKGYHLNDGQTKAGKDIEGFWYQTRQGLIESGATRGLKANVFHRANDRFPQGYFTFDKSYYDMYHSPWYELGYGQSIAKEDHRITFNSEEDYQPEVWDASARDRYKRVLGERIDKIADPYGGYGEDRDSYQMRKWVSEPNAEKSAVQTGYRIARLVDLADRVDKYFDTIYQDIGFEGSKEEKQQLTRSWLAENNPALYGQYTASQKLSEEYKDSNVSSLPKDQQISWIIEQVNKNYLHQVEEFQNVVDAYTSIAKETPTLLKTVLKSFHPENFGRASIETIEETYGALKGKRGIGIYGEDSYIEDEKKRMEDMHAFEQKEVEELTQDDFDDIAMENKAITDKLKEAGISDALIDEIIGLKDVLEDDLDQLKEALTIGDKTIEEIDEFFLSNTGDYAQDYKERVKAAEVLLYDKDGGESDFLEKGVSDYVARERELYDEKLKSEREELEYEENYRKDLKEIRDNRISEELKKRAMAVASTELDTKIKKEEETADEMMAEAFAQNVEAAQRTAVAQEQIAQKKEELAEVEAQIDSQQQTVEETHITKKKKKPVERKKKAESDSQRAHTVSSEIVSNIDKNVDVIANQYFPSLFEWLSGVNETLLAQTNKNNVSNKAFSQKPKVSAEEIYEKALKEEYSLRLKIEQLKQKKGNTKDITDDEIANYDKLISALETQLKLKHQIAEDAAKGVSDTANKSNLLSRYEAEHQLKLAEMARKAAGGSGGGGSQKKGLWEQLGYSKDGIIRQVTQYFSLYRILGKLRQEFQKIINMTKELDKAATNIRIVTGQSREEVDNAILSYRNLAAEIGTTTTALATSANEWLRQGYSVAESMDLIKATTQLSKLGMLDMNSATKVLTSTLKGFKMEASEAGTIVDKLTKLDMNYAASAGEIGEAMSRTSAIASQMGMSLDETAAMVTTIMDVTQQSAEMAGTAVRSILSRYGNVKAGSFVSMMTEDEDLEKINDIEKVLSVLGISIRTSKMEMRNMGDVLDELATKWNTLSSVEQNAVATAFAGTRQRNQFQVLLSNWQEVREAQEIAASSAGTADEKYSAYMDSIEASVNKVTQAWENFTTKLNSSKAIKGFLDFTARVVQNLDKIIISITSMITALNAYKLPAIFSGIKTKVGNVLHGNFNSDGHKFGIVRNGFSTVGQKLDAIRIAIEAQGGGSNGSTTANTNTIKSKYKQNQIFSVKANNGKTVEAAYVDGKWISTKKGKEITGKSTTDALNAETGVQKSAARKARIGMSVATGVVAGIQGAITGPKDTFGIFRTKDVSIDDVQSDTGDKLINGVATGAATGLLTAIPGVGPILGPILGPIIGDGIGGLFKWLRHKDEIDRKQRVEDAKKELEGLTKLESATKGVESAVYDLSTTRAVIEAKKAVDELVKTILDDSDNREALFNKLADFNIKNTNDLERVLLGSDDNLKAQILDIINNYTSGEKAEAEFRAQEQDRFEAQKKFEDTYAKADSSSYIGYNLNKSRFGDYFTNEYDTRGNYRSTLKGVTYEEKVENAKAAAEAMRETLDSDPNLTDAEKKYLEEEIKKLDEISKEYSNYQATSERLNRELWDEELSKAFSDAQLSTWSSIDVAGATLEEVVQTFADKLELTGQATRDYTGAITDAARQQIETFLRSNERFSALFAGSTKTLNDLIVTEQKQADLVVKTGAASYEELRDAFDHNVEDKMEKFAKEMLESSGKQVDATTDMTVAVAELKRQVYGADSSELDAFAKALHMTVDDVKVFKDQLGSVTLSDLLKTPAELRDSFDDLTSVFAALSSKGQLSGEILEKVNGQYFTLYNQYDEAGNIISTGAENILTNLRQRLFGSASDTSTQAFLYQNATFEQFRTNSDFYKGLKEEIVRRVNSGLLTVDDITKITNASNLNDIIEDIGNNSQLAAVLGEYLDGLNMENMYYQELQDKLVEWQKHENQVAIDNFQSQIDGLEKINDERQKEIDLIKAKDALENAKKEKKRVYRAGVGWTYEADAQAISEAQEKLEDIETEREKANIQYQIDLLEKQNDILEHIGENEQLEALKNIFEEYQTYMKKEFGEEVTSDMSSILNFMGKPRTMTWSDYIEIMGKEKEHEEDQRNMVYDTAMQTIAAQYQNMKSIEEKAVAEGKTIQQAQHSKDYIAAQETANAAYSQMLTAREQLKNSGTDMSTLKTLSTYFSEAGISANVEEEENAMMQNLSNQRYYYAGYGLDENGNQTNGGIRLKMAGSYTNDDISKFLTYYDENPGKVHVHKLNEYTEKFEKVSDINSLKSGDVVHLGNPNKSSGWDKVDEYAIKDGNSWRRMTKFANGSFGIKSGGPALINELGLEGIITPEGTVTSLPAKTGILPADLTRNLFDLGNVAPNLIKNLEENKIPSRNNNFGNTEDNSMSIGNFNATFNTIDNYDFEQLLIKARQYIAQTKNQRG